MEKDFTSVFKTHTEERDSSQNRIDAIKTAIADLKDKKEKGIHISLFDWGHDISDVIASVREDIDEIKRGIDREEEAQRAYQELKSNLEKKDEVNSSIQSFVFRKWGSPFKIDRGSMTSLEGFISFLEGKEEASYADKLEVLEALKQHLEEVKISEAEREKKRRLKEEKSRLEEEERRRKREEKLREISKDLPNFEKGFATSIRPEIEALSLRLGEDRYAVDHEINSIKMKIQAERKRMEERKEREEKFSMGSPFMQIGIRSLYNSVLDLFNEYQQEIQLVKEDRVSAVGINRAEEQKIKKYLNEEYLDEIFQLSLGPKEGEEDQFYDESYRLLEIFFDEWEREFKDDGTNWVERELLDIRGHYRLKGRGEGGQGDFFIGWRFLFSVLFVGGVFFLWKHFKEEKEEEKEEEEW